MPLAELMHAQPIDLINAVVVPILIAIVLGIPLAIYTGLVTSRMLLFSGERQRARAEIILAGKRFNRVMMADDDVSAQYEINTLLVEPIQALLHEQNQKRAAAGLARLVKEIGDDMMTTRRFVRAKKPVIDDAVANAIQGVLDRLAQRAENINHLAPNYWEISYIPHFGRWFDGLAKWLGRSDCGDCCQNCKRVL